MLYIWDSNSYFSYKSDEKMRVWGSSIEGNNFWGASGACFVSPLPGDSTEIYLL